MLTKAGILSLIAGGIIFVLSGISGFMESQNFWVGLTISRFLSDNASDSLILFTDVEVIQDSLYFLIVELPFSAFLMGLGILLLIISLFFKNY